MITKTQAIKDLAKDLFLNDDDLFQYLGHFASGTISSRELLEQISKILTISEERADAEINGEVLYVDDYGDPVREKPGKDYDWEGA